MTAALTLVLAGCATVPSGYSDGAYTGSYNGGYYAAAHDGQGDYYYDRPEVVYDDYSGFSPGFGFGYAAFGWGWGFDPWFYRPWWGHRRWCDRDHDHDHDHHGPWPHAVAAHSMPVHAMPARSADAHGGFHGVGHVGVSRGWQHTPAH